MTIQASCLSGKLFKISYSTEAIPTTLVYEVESCYTPNALHNVQIAMFIMAHHSSFRPSWKPLPSAHRWWSSSQRLLAAKPPPSPCRWKVQELLKYLGIQGPKGRQDLGSLGRASCTEACGWGMRRKSWISQGCQGLRQPGLRKLH